MRKLPICSSISRIFISSCLLLAGVAALAQPSETKILELENKEVPFFNGIAVSADLVGPVMLLVGDYGQYEAELRVNLKNKYFPVVELGYGKADADDAATRLSYKTKAPYGRVGMDFNLLKNKRDVNRLYGGLRYAYTSYKFDLFCPGVTDPTWRSSRRRTWPATTTGWRWFSEWMRSSGGRFGWAGAHATSAACSTTTATWETLGTFRATENREMHDWEARFT